MVTCMGGLGRSGTVAACALVAAGAHLKRPLRRCEPLGARALETAGQEDFVATFAAEEACRR